ncbi:cytokine-dependent hematopoietic cell linker [Megalops cyprinoides]|uniref:cytokine-dependent hematopoietic cell linker n=1 Tax=Megalops cyprinoides TaxID=118141 RepID=UPI00186434F3|nr:cytokine-dependent hematopoietic cell linker [Megalops cyprinoides]
MGRASCKAKKMLFGQKERSTRGNKEQCCSKDSDEDEYHYVEDKEEALSVHIRPARPFTCDSDYADRRYYRSPSPQLCSPEVAKSPDTPPRLPTRNIPGPSVNRDLKPGKKQSLQLRMKRETPPLFSSFSQDLEFCKVKDSRSLQNPSHHSPAGENHKGKQRHHEWPQTRGDMNNYRHVAKPRPPQTSDNRNWYIGACERVDAEHALHLMNKDGAFLVRDHSKCTVKEPFVLSLFYSNRVFNIKIRFIESIHKYALGTGLRTNDVFDSVDEIIKFHMIFPIVLINGKDQSVQRRCTLTHPLTKEDFDQILG